MRGHDLFSAVVAAAFMGGAILGFGYAPWTGAPLSWIDMQGASAALARCRELQARDGDRYAPPSSLVVMAETGGRYHKAPPPP